jgi:uncharacterized protein
MIQQGFVAPPQNQCSNSPPVHRFIHHLTFGDNLLVRFEETITAHGHPNLLATHRSTLELTKEPTLRREGDCIIAVGANKGARDLSAGLKRLLSMENSSISFTIEVNGLREVVRGRGHPGLSFQNSECMVFRKSNYVCGRTVMIQADKAAADINRDLVRFLRQKETMVKVTIEVSDQTM